MMNSSDESDVDAVEGTLDGDDGESEGDGVRLMIVSSWKLAEAEMNVDVPTGVANGDNESVDDTRLYVADGMRSAMAGVEEVELRTDSVDADSGLVKVSVSFPQHSFAVVKIYSFSC